MSKYHFSWQFMLIQMSYHQNINVNSIHWTSLSLVTLGIGPSPVTLDTKGEPFPLLVCRQNSKVWKKTFLPLNAPASIDRRSGTVTLTLLLTLLHYSQQHRQIVVQSKISIWHISRYQDLSPNYIATPGPPPKGKFKLHKFIHSITNSSNNPRVKPYDHIFQISSNVIHLF